LDVGERLAEGFCDPFGEHAVGGSTDKFHGKEERAAVARPLLTVAVRSAILCL
jgi:hypothetical protein